MWRTATLCFNKHIRTIKPTWSGEEEKTDRKKDLEFMFWELDHWSYLLSQSLIWVLALTHQEDIYP